MDSADKYTSMVKRRRQFGVVAAALLTLSLFIPTAQAGFVGEDLPESFSVCEDMGGAGTTARPECQGGDIRFEATDAVASRFGFAIASGNLNGDDYQDLVVGDPERNRVYIFFGRKSAVAGYGLDVAEQNRGVSAESQADVIIELAAGVPIDSVGFSLAVGRERVTTACGVNELAAPLAIGAPGTPGEQPGVRGAVFYIAAGSLCLPAVDPASPVMRDPVAISEVLRAPFVDNLDEFGYSVAFGRLLENTGNDEDVIVGARGAMNGSGRVTIFPVNDGDVDNNAANLVELAGEADSGLGEVLAVGDLDGDFDEMTEPMGDVDDLAVGAVGSDAGTVLLVNGPLSSTGGNLADGVFDVDEPELRTITGESSGDYFGFSVALSDDGRLAVGSVFADNNPPANGGDAATNVGTLARTHSGKLYVWAPGIFNLPVGEDLSATSADLTLVGRRSADQAGFGAVFSDLDESGVADLVFSAPLEDGTGTTIDEIDQGTLYVALDNTFLSTPLDLGGCSLTSDCTGVGGIDVMLFGGDREDNLGNEIGFAVTAGDFNGDGSPEIYASSIKRRQVYAISLLDSDDDRTTEGRNLRDDDDDGDTDPDSSDCDPLDAAINANASEIACNQIDENCNGDLDDTPDDDADGFDLCGDQTIAPDCDDDDPLSYPGASELCDGNDNACGGLVPTDETDTDGDNYVTCSGWADAQADDAAILGGDDCDDLDPDAFPGAAAMEDPAADCRRDADGDGFGESDPPAGITAGTDCDDISLAAPFTFPGAATLEANPGECRKDEDGDGYGDDSPIAGVVAGTDCDDVDAISFPGAAELCDGNDNACSGLIPTDESDSDADFWVECVDWDDVQGDDPVIAGGQDCNDADMFTHPMAAPNESTPMACRRDADGDDYGDVMAPVGGAPGTDCDDASLVTFPGAAQIEAPLNCMKDGDDDGYGDATAMLPVVPGSDCDDDDPTSSLAGAEIPDDGIDQDCNGFDSVTCFEDVDRDGFGSTDPIIAVDGDCTDPGEAAVDTDCDDGDENIFPGAAEIPDDGIDQDCNTFDTISCFVDGDGDGFGDLSATTTLADDESCDAVDGESTTSDDCADDDASTYPGAPQLCDGNDNSCAAALPVDETDGDGDGYVVCSGWNDAQGDNPMISGGDDCDDDADDIFPGAAPLENTPNACMRDRDRDGYGDNSPPTGITAGTDCDDLSPVTFPGAAAIDGPFNCMRDADDDDYGDSAAVLPVVAGFDCDDSDAASFPGATELCDGNDNSCGGSVPFDEIDDDGDLYVECVGWVDPQGDNASILGGEDCLEGDASTFPGAASNEPFATACMTDFDGDGYGDVLPIGGVTAGTDCDDMSLVTFPGAAQIEAPFNCMRDADDDGYGDSTANLPVVAGQDCADDEPTANPGQIEGPAGDATCTDSLDNDCDSNLDGADLGCQITAACPDVDDDNYADCTTEPTCDSTGLTCGDCNDLDASVNPGVAELCDNLDNNCDGTIDEGFDADADGFTVCDLPLPDCDDSDPDVNPLELEVCGDSVDNDCDVSTPDIADADMDGADCLVDCNDNDPLLNLADLDMDTFSSCDNDCDDNDPLVNPGAAEVCADSIDNDCNLATPDIFDADMDGADCLSDCDDADPLLNLDDLDFDGFSSCTNDCDDGEVAVNPNAIEVCDSIDNDCNGVVDGEFDGDSDGFTTCSGPLDCNDSDPLVNPGAVEVCGDSTDNDCNAATPDLFDMDGDGAACDIDCDDQDGSSYPGAPEVCDGNDNNCDMLLPTSETDADMDGYVACPVWNDTQGDQPSIIAGGDCNPAAPDTYPGAAALESFAMACMKDSDLDDYGDLDPPTGVTPGTDCDDNSITTFPGAAQIEAPLNCMRDDDDDGYGASNAVLPVVSGGDCNDSEPLVNFGQEESNAAGTCSDNLDNDCDGLTDAADPVCQSGIAPNRGVYRNRNGVRRENSFDLQRRDDEREPSVGQQSTEGQPTSESSSSTLPPFRNDRAPQRMLPLGTAWGFLLLDGQDLPQPLWGLREEPIVEDEDATKTGDEIREGKR